MIGASIALSISDIPWNGPISGVSVGLVDGEFVINPNAEQRKVSPDWTVTVASTDEQDRHDRGRRQRGCRRRPCSTALWPATRPTRRSLSLSRSIQRGDRQAEKFSYPSSKPEPGMFEAIRGLCRGRMCGRPWIPTTRTSGTSA